MKNDPETLFTDPGRLGSALKMTDERSLRTIDDLAHLIIDIWNAISEDEMENLVNSMPNTFAVTFQAQGGSNGYVKHRTLIYSVVYDANLAGLLSINTQMLMKRREGFNQSLVIAGEITDEIVE